MRSSKAPILYLRHGYVVALLFACAVSSGFAQQTQNGGTSLSVLVTDAQQRAVAGAVCSLSLAVSNSTVDATASTDEQGIAKFPATVIPGKYNLRVESPGFETINRHDLFVKNGEITKVAISLKV